MKEEKKPGEKGIDTPPAEGDGKKEPEKRAAVEAWQVRPLGTEVVIVADLPPIKSKEGIIDLPADPTIEDYYRKGTVVAVGPDVKRVKVGDKAVYPFSSCFELERYYRRTYASEVISKWLVKEGDIEAIYRPAVLTDMARDNVVHCLRAADLQEIREAHYGKLEGLANANIAKNRSPLLIPGAGGGKPRIQFPH